MSDQGVQRIIGEFLEKSILYITRLKAEILKNTEEAQVFTQNIHTQNHESDHNNPRKAHKKHCL